MVKKSTTLFKLILLLIIMLAVFMPSVFAANELTNSINNYTSEMFKQRAMANTSKSDATANNFVTQNYQAESLHALGQTVNIQRFEIGYFCLNKGNEFSPGKYNVYEIGNISDLELKNFPVDRHMLSFVAGEEKLASDKGLITNRYNRNIQPWSHFVWVNLGVNKAGSNPDPSRYAGMLAKYNAYNKIRNDVVLSNTNPLDIIPVDPAGNDIATTEITPANAQNGQLTSNGVWVANDQGQLRVKVEYPWDEKLNTGYDAYPDPDHYLDMIKVKISLNDTVIFSSHEPNVDNKLTDGAGNPFKIGDKEAYLPVEMVEYGTSVKFKVEWSFRKYEDGQYAKLTPYHSMFYVLDCVGLHVRFEFEGYRIKAMKSGGLLDWSYEAGMAKLKKIGTNNPNRSYLTLAEQEAGKETGRVESFTYVYDNSNPWLPPLTVTHYIHIYNEEEDKWEVKYKHDHKQNDINNFGKLMYLHIKDNEETGEIIEEDEVEYNPEDLYTQNQDLLHIVAQSTEITRSKELTILVGKPNIKLSFEKLNALDGSKLPDAQFEITVVNGAVVVGNGTQNPYTITTNGDFIEIEIKPDNGGQNINQIIVKFKEIAVPDPDGFIMYQSDVEITYTWNSTTSSWEQTNIIVPDKEEVTTANGADKNMWIVSAKNRAQISELSGHVWIDEPQGEKGIQPPNGKYDMNEKFKEGVQVYLYQSDGTQVTQDAFGNTYGTNGYLITDANGAYKFEKIEKKLNVSYYILFKYDGINYIRTYAGDSKADEKQGDRTTFNGKFKTISAGTSNGGVALTYSYDGSGKSTLITENQDKTVKLEFEMKADTQTAGNVYNQKATDIDLGLRPKTLDLSLMMDIYDAEVSINGVAPLNALKYNKVFDEDMNLIIDISQNRVTDDNIKYNMNLYRSDYSYRIGDYMGNNPAMAHQPELDAAEEQAFEAAKQELLVKITYILVLNNQSVTEAQVDSVDYYYDSHLTYNSIKGGTATQSGNKLTIVPTNKNLPYGGQSKIELEFTLKLDKLDNQPTITNAAEITQYSTTEGGFVDCDSAPGNGLNGNTVSQYEDDCDESHGLQINVSQTEREISGYVFEDKKDVQDEDSGYMSGNGKMEFGETKVDDVIVQLIEIKDLQVGATMHKLEYIWQETTSGSNVVKRISDDGKKIEQYQVPAETGKYTFQGFIPGQYIVRFIYGDGTYYDTAINTNNILKYNGLDYKSTTDANYSSKYLKTKSYAETASMARDNEARRLTVMKYALQSSNSDDLNIDNKAKLEKTWMPADTSILPVTDIVIEQGNSSYKADVNFGLMLRPVTTIALRKHIGYVSLKGGVGNLNVEASADMNKSYSDQSVTVANLSKSAESNPLTAQATTRSNRGYWQVEANEIEGANLKITYKYIVKNIGEREFLRNDLAIAFKHSNSGYEEDLKNYITEMDKRIAEVNKAMKKSTGYNIETSYLGQAYYTGKKGASDTEVTAYVYLEDYLSNEFTVDPTSDFKVVAENVKKQTKDISGNDDTEEVRVLQTKTGGQIKSDTLTEFKLTLIRNGLTASDSLSYPSYIAQVIIPTTNLAGTKITGTTPNNLPWVQAYAKMATLENLNAEEDEYWAETFQIVPTTGEDKQSKSMLVYGITGGLAIIAVGVVLIKKFIIK